MSVDGVLRGDPLEASALEGIRWAWNATSHTARPRQDPGYDDTFVSNPNGGSYKETVETNQDIEGDNTKNTPMGKSEENADDDSIATGDGEGVVLKGGAEDDTVAVEVWRRYAFSSQLQRMSVVAEVKGVGLTAEAKTPEVRTCATTFIDTWHF